MKRKVLKKIELEAEDFGEILTALRDLQLYEQREYDSLVHLETTAWDRDNPWHREELLKEAQNRAARAFRLRRAIELQLGKTADIRVVY